MLPSDRPRQDTAVAMGGDAVPPARQYDANLSEMLGETSRLLDGPWHFGYSSEFTAYAEYAQSHPESYSE